MNTIRARMTAIERRHPPQQRPWYNLSRWRADRGLSLEEQERRLLSVHPERSGEITVLFAQRQMRRAEVDNMDLDFDEREVE